MKLLSKILNVVQIILNIFLALTALAGCIQLVEGTYAPPVETLQGSLFKDFTIPGLMLGLVVGGSAAFATVLLFRRNRFAFLFSAAAGLTIMVFEFVEVMVIGSPDLISRTLQIGYISLGALLITLSLGSGFLHVLAGK
jgi:hypothetical protein